MVNPDAADTRKLLDIAAEGIKRGRIAEGKAKLELVLKRDPQNVLALLWMTKCVETTPEKLEYFQRVLQIDPANAHAIRGIQLYSIEPRPTGASHSSSPPRPSRDSEPPSSEPSRPCPFCNEPIAADVATCPHCGRRLHTASAPYPAENSLRAQLPTSSPTHQSPTSCAKVAFVALGVVFLIWLLARCGEGPSGDNSRVPTADAAGQAAIRAVQNLSTPLGDNMIESVAIALTISETQGHRATIDGWYVRNAGQYYIVSIDFFLDGKPQSGEWSYYPDGTIIPMTDWAFVFMGQ